MHLLRRASRGTLVLLLVAGCSSSTTAPPPLVTGSYSLVKYNGHQLPYNTGPMPPKGQNPGGCPVLVTEGRLEINAELSTFWFQYDLRNGCTQELMSQLGLQGTYEQQGRKFTFIVTRSDGAVFRHDGSVSASSIVFQAEDEVLEFSRR